MSKRVDRTIIGRFRATSNHPISTVYPRRVSAVIGIGHCRQHSAEKPRHPNTTKIISSNNYTPHNDLYSDRYSNDQHIFVQPEAPSKFRSWTKSVQRKPRRARRRKSRRRRTWKSVPQKIPAWRREPDLNDWSPPPYLRWGPH